MKSIEIPRIPKSSKNRGTPLGPKTPFFDIFKHFHNHSKKPVFSPFFDPQNHQIHIQNQFKSKNSMKIHRKSNENQKNQSKIQKNSKNKKNIHIEKPTASI